MIQENIVLATFAPRHMASLRLPSTWARLLCLIHCGASRCSDKSVAAARDPRPQPLLLCGDRRRRRNPLRHFPPFFPSPPRFMHHHLALWQRRGPLVKPCCHSRWHLPPYLHSKCQKRRRWLFDFYLFMWCFFPATPLLLNNFQTILYRLKEGERKKKGKERKTGERPACVRELSGGCHVGLLCSAYTRPPHEFMSLKMQKKSRSV